MLFKVTLMDKISNLENTPSRLLYTCLTHCIEQWPVDFVDGFLVPFCLRFIELDFGIAFSSFYLTIYKKPASHLVELISKLVNLLQKDSMFDFFIKFLRKLNHVLLSESFIPIVQSFNKAQWVQLYSLSDVEGIFLQLI